jgi:hypothetical protein
METENKSTDIFGNEMPVDAMAKQYIRSMASWAMVIVVTAVIGYVLNVIDLFRAKPVGSRTEGFGMDFTPKFGASEVFSTVFFILIGLLINFFLYRFATLARAGVEGLDQVKLNRSFSNLKAFFMACTIVLIIIFVYVLLAAVVLGARGIS